MAPLPLPRLHSRYYKLRSCDTISTEVSVGSVGGSGPFGKRLQSCTMRGSIDVLMWAYVAQVQWILRPCAQARSGDWCRPVSSILAARLVCRMGICCLFLTCGYSKYGQQVQEYHISQSKSLRSPLDTVALLVHPDCRFLFSCTCLYGWYRVSIGDFYSKII